MSQRQRRRKDERRKRAQGHRPSKRKLAAGAGLTIGAALGVTGTAHATDFTVNSLLDDGDGTCDLAAGGCTLRDALDDANDNSGPDDVLFQSGLSGTITLNQSFLPINDEVNVFGPGADTLAVSGDHSQQIAYVYAPSGEPVLIDGLTLRYGSTGNGAAIYSGGIGIDSELTISDSVLTGNSASDDGGAIQLYNGDLIIQSSTISGNSANRGGAIGVRYGDYLYVGSSTLRVNTASSEGGAIDIQNSNDAGQSVIKNSTISGNMVTGGNGDGGALYLAATNQGELEIRNSTLSGNTVTDSGGAIYDFALNGPALTVDSSTISGNTASDAGGGIYQYYGETLINTIVANNSAPSGPDLYGPNPPGTFGAPIDLSFSLIEDPSDAVTNETVAGSNVYNQDPQLQDLAANGGPTLTQAPLATSPALDRGSTTLFEDQRIFDRPLDLPTIANSTATGADASDIGAVELQSLTDSQPAPAGGGASAAGEKTTCKGKTATIFPRPGLARTFTGTNKRDVIVGTNAKDKINSRGGNDLICARGGGDTVNAGGGKDKAFGQGGKDRLLGKGGKDKLVGGARKDTLIGGGAADTLLGKGGNDVCIGGPGGDVEKSC